MKLYKSMIKILAITGATFLLQTLGHLLAYSDMYGMMLMLVSKRVTFRTRWSTKPVSQFLVSIDLRLEWSFLRKSQVCRLMV